MKKAIITGVTGQDGAYLSKLLLSKGYKVYGTFRRNSSVNFWRLEELKIKNHENFELIEYDLTDSSAAVRIIDVCEPDEIYNLAAQSFVGVSFDQPITTGEITGLSVVNILEAVRILNRNIKFYQASTSEMFGKVQSVPQNENTPFYPRSPYGVAKLYAHWMTINYRESYDIFASSGILFNHESPLRGLEFVTRKITDGVAKISLGKLDCLELGNLDAKRDWGFAGDFVKGMHSILQAKNSDTFVLATNKTETVRTFLKLAFKRVGIDINFKGSGKNEIGIDETTGKEIVRVNEKFYRPAEVDLLIGDYGKAMKELSWKPVTTLEELCNEMVDADLQRNKDGRIF